MYQRGGNITIEYKDLFKRDLAEAIKQLPLFLERVRNIGDRGYESFAEGPNHDWACPLLNIIGNLYPLLSEEERNLAFQNVLNYLDGINSSYAQNHLKHMHEPWLVRDIVINRWIYWPGFEEYIHFFKQDPINTEFAEKILSSKSKCWFAYATIYNKEILSVQHREKRQIFYTAFPNLTDRTLDFIAARIKQGAITFAEKEGQTEAKYILEHFENVDPFVHERLKGKMYDRKWLITN